MSKRHQSTAPDRKESTSEFAELERVATALRTKFLEKFRQRWDPNGHYFYRQMAFDHDRFRVMRLHEDSLPNRLGPEYDERDLYGTRSLRHELGQYLKSFCQESADVMKWLIETLGRVHQDIDWIELEAEKIWPMIEKEYRVWIQIACYGSSAEQESQAPGWLDKWPADLPSKALLSAARGGRLDTDRTTRVLKEIVNRIRDQLAPAQESALDDLRIRFFVAKETARQDANATPKSLRSRLEPWSDPGGKQSKDTEEPAAWAATNAKRKVHGTVEDTNADMTVVKDAIQIMERKAKRGPKANMDFHRGVAEVVHRFGLNWKEHLGQIAEALGRCKPRLPPSAKWERRRPPARSWKRAVEYYPDIVLKRLEYSLKMAAKDIAR